MATKFNIPELLPQHGLRFHSFLKQFILLLSPTSYRVDLNIKILIYKSLNQKSKCQYEEIDEKIELKFVPVRRYETLYIMI